MLLDSSTRRNLELCETLREKQKRGSLLWVLDKTKTAYDLLLERPEWKAYRLKVLAEKGEKCEWCGSTNKILQVHHIMHRKAVLYNVQIIRNKTWRCFYDGNSS